MVFASLKSPFLDFNVQFYVYLHWKPKVDAQYWIFADILYVDISKLI